MLHVCVYAELESRGKQSIRVDCRPAGGLLDQGDIVEGLDEEEQDYHEDNYLAADAGGVYERHDHRVEPVITTTSYVEPTESTERAMTSEVTSSGPDAETGAAMTTGGVTSSHPVTDDYSSVNNSCECLTNCDVTDERVVTSR